MTEDVDFSRGKLLIFLTPVKKGFKNNLRMPGKKSSKMTIVIPTKNDVFAINTENVNAVLRFCNNFGKITTIKQNGAAN